MKPAVVMVHPRHLDYPVSRWNLERFQDYFDGIYVGFSDHHVENQDLTNFLRDKMPFVHFVEVIRTGDDWRNDAVNCILKEVDSEYILFMEQDFLIHDSTFFEKVLKDDRDFIYFKEDARIHPAFACVKRELIEKTSKDFSATPPGDHFYKFFDELPEGVNIDTLGVEKRVDYYHMNGLSQNYQCFRYADPFYSPANFLYYNFKSLQFPDQHPLFNQIQQQIERMYGHSPKHSFLDKFFPEV